MIEPKDKTSARVEKLVPWLVALIVIVGLLEAILT